MRAKRKASKKPRRIGRPVVSVDRKQRVVIEDDARGSIIVYRDSEEVRASKIVEEGAEARRAIDLTPGQLRTLRAS